MRLASSAVVVCAGLLCGHGLRAEPGPEPSVRFVVQHAIVAGLRYHDAPAIWPQLRAGMAVSLVREPDNPHDPGAVRVQLPSALLGYLSRRDNAALGWALDQGHPIGGRIARLEILRNGARRMEIEVYAE